MAVNMAVVWDVPPYRLVDVCRRYVGICCLHHLLLSWSQHVRLRGQLCHIPRDSSLGLDWCRKRVSATDVTNTAMSLKLVFSQFVSILPIFYTPIIVVTGPRR